jgi:hypothetical protein
MLPRLDFHHEKRFRVAQIVKADFKWQPAMTDAEALAEREKLRDEVGLNGGQSDGFDSAQNAFLLCHPNPLRLRLPGPR